MQEFATGRGRDGDLDVLEVHLASAGAQEHAAPPATLDRPDHVHDARIVIRPHVDGPRSGPRIQEPAERLERLDPAVHDIVR